jgi:hypothetical protein
MDRHGGWQGWLVIGYRGGCAGALGPGAFTRWRDANAGKW